MANWSGLWDGTSSAQVAAEAHTLISGKSPNRYHLSRMFRKRGLKELGELMSTLNGVTTGSSASYAYNRVTATANTSSNVQGGVRSIESKQQVGLLLDSAKLDASSDTARNSTSTDQTTINEILLGTGEGLRSPSTYVTDASGNGGGGKGEGV